MYKQIAILLFLLIPVFVQAQNLVPNGSFEYDTACPIVASQTAFAPPWRQYHGATSDYFHVCGATNVQVPGNFIGYQLPAQGNAYMGVVSYPNASLPTLWTEYIAAPMTAMSIGHRFEVSISVSRANNSTSSCDGLGVWFYDSGPISTLTSTTATLNITPQIRYQSYGVITDTQNWVRLTATMTADSAYDNIVIGTFTPSGGLTTVGAPTGVAYYYIDSVVVRAILSFNLTDTTLCIGDTLNLPFSAASQYYSPTNIFSLELSNVSGSFSNPLTIATVAGNAGGIFRWIIPNTIPVGANYRVRIKSSSPVDSSADNGKNISISAYPIPIASSNAPVCEGSSIMLLTGSITPVDSYLWFGPNLFNATGNIIFKSNALLTDSGSYNVMAIYKGCIAYDTTKVIVKKLPAKPILITNNPLCEDDTLFLKANSSTATSYNWIGPFSFLSNSKDTFVSKVNLLHAGNYFINAWLNGCYVKDSVNISVIQRPRPAIISNSPICEKETLLLQANETISGETYNWGGPNSFSGSTKTMSKPAIQVNATGKYWVTVNYNGCINTDTTDVLVKPLPPKTNAIANTPICEQDTLFLHAQIIKPGVTFHWSGPDNYSAIGAENYIATISLNKQGLYIITSTLDGCTQRDTTEVLVKPLPEKPVINSNSPLQTGQDLYLNLDNPQANVKYRWTGPNGFTSVVPNPIIYKPDTNSIGTYFLIAELNGCYNSNQVLVQIDQKADTGNIFLYPNPNNGDFYIKGVFKTDQQTPIHIFDGAGKLVYTHSFKTNNKKLFEAISLKDYLASGEYSLHIIIDGKKKILRFTVIR